MRAARTDPEVMKYIGDGKARTLEQTAEGIARAIREWDERGHGMFSVDRRDTGEFIGWVALTVPLFLPEVLPAIEIGWRLARQHWGRGFATEAAREALRFGFESCGLDAIISIRHVDNEASRRVMEKLGLHFDFLTEVPSHGQPVAVHSISRAEFIKEAEALPVELSAKLISGRLKILARGRSERACCQNQGNITCDDGMKQ